MRVSTNVLGFHVDATLEPRRRAAAGPSWLDRLRAWLGGAWRRASEPGLDRLSEAAIRDLGLDATGLPGHWRHDPLRDAARRCMKVPFWPGMSLRDRDDRAR
jgi:hypothetical protein